MTITTSIGIRVSENLTVTNVVGTGPWTVTVSSVPAAVKVGDKISQSSVDWLITAIVGSDLTVQNVPFAGFAGPAVVATTSTRAYASARAFGDAIPNGYTESRVGQVWNDGEIVGSSGALFTMVGITPTPNDGTITTRLEPAPGQGFADHPNAATNSLRYDATKGVALRRTFIGSGNAAFVIQSPQVTVRGLQIKDNDQFSMGLDLRSGSTVRECIVETSVETVAQVISGNLINCILVGFDNSTNSLCTMSGGAISANVIGCSGYGFGTSSRKGFDDQSGTSGWTVKDCVFFLQTGTVWNGPLAGTIDYCASSGTPPGVNSVGGLTATDHFESVASFGTHDLRLKTTSSIKASGTRLQSFTNDKDIIGKSRSITTPSIGAWEVQGSSQTTASGSLSGQSGSMSGSAVSSKVSSGSFAGQAGTLSGSAVSSRTASGSLVGQSGALSGSAVLIGTGGNAASGSLVGQAGSLAGSSGRVAGVLGTKDNLAGQSGSLQGSAGRVLPGSGGLAGQSATLQGSAAAARASTGSFIGQPGTLSGTASVVSSGGANLANGNLAGAAALLAGSSIRIAGASGALTASPGGLQGSAVVVRAAFGSLVGQAAMLSGGTGTPTATIRITLTLPRKHSVIGYLGRP